MNSDKVYFYDAQVDANVYFDGGKVKEGIMSLYNHLDTGYRPIDMHMHILMFASLRKRLMIQRRPAIRDKEVELANKTLLNLSRLVNLPLSLLSCVPTCERGSSERCSDYDVRDYAVFRNANRMIKDAKGGIWDLVMESREAGDKANVQDQHNDEDDDDNEDDLDEDPTWRGSKRKSTGRNTKVKKEKKPKRQVSPDATTKTQRAPSSSPLTEIEDEDEEDEVVNKNAWLLLSWIIDLWTRAKCDTRDPYNDPFLKQLPSQGGFGPRWSIARPMVVVRSAVKSACRGVYCDPFEVGSKMLSLLYSYTKMDPPAIDPEALFHATIRELLDIDISEGKDRVERYLEMLRSATDTEFYNSVLAHAAERLTDSGSLSGSTVTLPMALEWLSTARLSDKRPRGVALTSHEEKYSCIKAYLLVSLLTSVTDPQLQEWPLERRKESIDKIFTVERSSTGQNSFRNVASQHGDCTTEDYKALVMTVHHCL